MSGIRLRRYRADDLDRLTALLTDPAVMDPVGGVIAASEVPAILARYLMTGDPEILAVRAAELEDGTYAGSGRLVQRARDAPEIGYLVRREHRGRGVGTAIARELVAIARRDHGASHVWATVDPGNAASIRVLERAGFERTGTEEDAEGTYFVYVCRERR